MHSIFTNWQPHSGAGPRPLLGKNDGLIVRSVYPEIPPKVEYEMSDFGHKFEKALAELEVWGNEYIEYLSKRSDR